MSLQIKKRDGRLKNFDANKIRSAILRAFQEVDGEVTDYAVKKANNIAEYIEKKAEELEEDAIFTIEEIQDLVEHGLMSLKDKKYAKAYVLYREERRKAREKENPTMKLIAEKLKATNIQNQNANVDEASFGGRRGEADSALMKQFALDYCMSDMAKENHLNNEIYIHDLDSYAVGMHNCLSVPFDDLLANGFNTRQTDIRPANSINTAFQLVAVVFQLQSLQQFGGVSATHLDWTMVPYVRKSFAKHYVDQIRAYLAYTQYVETPDGDFEKAVNFLSMSPSYLYTLSIDDKEFQWNEKIYSLAIMDTEKELQQAVEGMYHNLNTLQSRSGNQLPFTSINYGTCTLPEGRMVTKALLEGSIKGVGKFHKTPIFPCGIFQCMKGVNRAEGDPNYDLFKLALRSTAQRLYPNYANVDWSGNEGYDPNDPRTYFSTMGCRTANGWDINGFGQLKDGRGNIAPVTIILPTLAMQAKELAHINYLDHQITEEAFRVRTFMTLLEDKIREAKDMLIERFDYICSQDPSSAKFMYENNTMAGYIPEEGIRSALKHGTLAIGQLGLAETLQILIGENQTRHKGMKLAKKIESLFKERCADYKELYKLNFGVYYTPAENLCYTAMQKFKATYGEIPGVSENDFFTNSMHVPVWEQVTPFEKIDIESQLTGYSSAGCITYVEFDASAKNNLEALEAVVQYAMDKDIPYFAINVPCDTCLDCGYTDDMNDTCKECGGHHIQHLRRVTGYLTGDYKTAFNRGKQQEVSMRFQHTKKS